MDVFKIGAAARQLGLSERRIREYERAGLIRPRREPNTGDRLFGRRELTQLRLIQHLIHEKGFTLEAFKELLRYAPCWELTKCELKDACSIPRNPTVPCYEQRAAGAYAPCDAECEFCPIYLTKEQPRSHVVIAPRGESAPIPSSRRECLGASASRRQDAANLCKHKP
jgi:MerR family transcriptional regulator/heat shock protein HspR